MVNMILFLSLRRYKNYFTIFNVHKWMERDKLHQIESLRNKIIKFESILTLQEFFIKFFHLSYMNNTIVKSAKISSLFNGFCDLPIYEKGKIGQCQRNINKADNF
jgi:hypothetical protein